VAALAKIFDTFFEWLAKGDEVIIPYIQEQQRSAFQEQSNSAILDVIKESNDSKPSFIVNKFLTRR